MTQLRRITIMAGGTGGHIFPALATAQVLASEGHSVSFLGSTGGMECDIVPKAGFPLMTLSIRGLRGKGAVSWLMAPLRLMRAVREAVKYLRVIEPDCVLGMGGFASGPGGVAARLMGIPLVIHEQNSVAGLTNRLLSRVARTVLGAFPGAFGADKPFTLVGNPVRAEIASRPVPAENRAPSDRPWQVLVLGGSLGAKALNDTVPAALALLPAAQRPVIRHQCGKPHVAATQQAYAGAGVTAEVASFIDDMGAAYAWADLVVCRAGALTIAELCLAGVASVLVPYPHAVDDHQTGNARYLVDHQAARLLPQSTMTAESLATLLRELLEHPETVRQMAVQAKLLAAPDASRRVAHYCLEACRG